MTQKKSIVIALLITLAAGCGDDDEDNGAATTNGTQETVVPTDPETGEPISVVGAMDIAIQREYQAEEIYAAVVEDFGAVQPFTNIVTAETKHSEAFNVLYEARGLDVPASDWNSQNVPRYETLQEACAAGVVLETATVARYDEWLATDLPADVERVFTNLRNASRDNHLPAFEQCVTNTRQGQGANR